MRSVACVSSCGRRLCAVRLIRFAGRDSCSAVGFLFFQAEDGIRDLVRSRGLGDVYKRQAGHLAGGLVARSLQLGERALGVGNPHKAKVDLASVSYTHLTLPTSDLV